MGALEGAGQEEQLCYPLKVIILNIFDRFNIILSVLIATIYLCLVAHHGKVRCSFLDGEGRGMVVRADILRKLVEYPSSVVRGLIGYYSREKIFNRTIKCIF